MNSQLAPLWMLAAFALTGCAQPIVCPDWTIYDPVMRECACDVDAGLQVNYDGTACLFPDGGMVLLPGRDAEAVTDGGSDAALFDAGVSMVDVGPFLTDRGAPELDSAMLDSSWDAESGPLDAALPDGNVDAFEAGADTGPADAGPYSDPALLSLDAPGLRLRPAFEPTLLRYSVSKFPVDPFVLKACLPPGARASIYMNGAQVGDCVDVTLPVEQQIVSYGVRVVAESGAERIYIVTVTVQ